MDFSTQSVMIFNSLVIMIVIGQEMLMNERALWVMFSSLVIRYFLGHQRSKLLSLFLLVKQNILLHHLEFAIQFGYRINYSVKTYDQLADIFTKPLKHEVFFITQSQLGKVT